MKRTISILLLAGLITVLLPHQSQAFVRLGLKGGVNWANFAGGEDNVDFKRLPGFSAGGQADIAILPALSVRTDLLYVQKGTQFRGVDNEGKVRLNEFVVAPFAVFRFPLAKSMPFLQVGPEMGLGLLAKQYENGEWRDVGPNYRKRNFSVNVGGGIIIPTGPSDITVDARYNIGLTKAQRGTVPEMPNNTNLRTDGFQVFVGFNFLKF